MPDADVTTRGGSGELSVHDLTVTAGADGSVVVSGSGSPDGATVTVQVELDGGGSASATTTISGGQWSVTVAVNAGPGATGTVSATVTEPVNFPGLSASAHTSFTLDGAGRIPNPTRVSGPARV